MFPRSIKALPECRDQQTLAANPQQPGRAQKFITINSYMDISNQREGIDTLALTFTRVIYYWFNPLFIKVGPG
jgi:hypothetical protein